MKKRKKERRRAEDAVMRSWFGYAAAPSVHTSDTSIEAAEKIDTHARTLRDLVFETIETYGALTDENIAHLSGLNPSTARPRRIELQREGRIIPAGIGVTAAGRKAQMWAVA